MEEVEDESMEKIEKTNKKSKKITKFKKNYRNIMLRASKNYKKSMASKKIYLRLLPKTNQTHQIMMKMNNFPRLELKLSNY